MGFLAPALPFIGSALGGLFGGGKPGRDNTEKEILKRQLGLTDMQIDMLGKLGGFAGGLEPTAMGNLAGINPWFPMTTTGIENAERRGNLGEDFLGQAKGAFTPAMDYWSGILRGGPDAMLALSPEIKQAQQAFQQAKTQTSQFAPMGGGRANVLAQLPQQQAGAITDIFSRARPAAAAGLSNLGAQAGGLGSALTGQNAALTASLAGTTAGLTGDLIRNIIGAYSGGAAGAGGGLQT